MKFLHPRVGQERVKRKFLIFPVTCPLELDGDIKQTRWLERAAWQQRYVDFHFWYNDCWRDDLL